eukprot:4506728-Karenia_brevis.AAC.1
MHSMRDGVWDVMEVNTMQDGTKSIEAYVLMDTNILAPSSQGGNKTLFAQRYVMITLKIKIDRDA